MRANIFVKILAFTKIPLMFFCRPKIIKINDEQVIVKIPFKRRVKNHVNSMYFGALAVGADLSGAYLAFHHINKTDKKIKLIFKDFHADFLKRAEGDVHFVCNDGNKIKSLIKEVLSKGERCSTTVNVDAFVPSKFKDDPVAKFMLTLSLK